MAKVILCSLIGVAFGLHLQENESEPERVYSYSFESDSGLFLTSCSECDQSHPNIAGLSTERSGSAWVMEGLVDDFYFIKNAEGSHLIAPQVRGDPVYVQQRAE